MAQNTRKYLIDTRQVIRYSRVKLSYTCKLIVENLGGATGLPDSPLRKPHKSPKEATLDSHQIVTVMHIDFVSATHGAGDDMKTSWGLRGQNKKP